MTRALLLQFFVIFLTSFVSNQICADDDLNSMNFERVQFTLTPPEDWRMVKPQPPFDYKVIHQDGDRECNIVISYYDNKIEKKHIFYEMVLAVRAIYGDDYHKQPNFSFGILNEELDDLLVWFFFWNKGTTIESVSVLACIDTIYENCSRCIVRIRKQDVEDFIFAKSYEGIMEDIIPVLRNIKCIKK